MFRRLSIALAAISILLLTAAAPALAGSSYISRTTGSAADAYWTQIDGTPVGSGAFGNVHIGNLYAFETSKGIGDVFVYIDDFDCEPGQEPYGGHGDEEGGCLYVGSRLGEGYGLAFLVGKKLSGASLRGTVTMISGGGHGEGGQVVGNPAVNMTWSATGTLIKDWSTYRYSDGTSTYTDRYRAQYRNATLDGSLGPMTFAPGLSGGAVSSFSQFSKGRTR